MNAYKKLLKNTGIFAIANFGSKLISIFLVPFYTYVLSKEQYGTIDMITNTILLLLPIVSLSIFESTLRFAKKSEYDSKDILSSSLLILLLGNLIFFALYPILKKIDLFKEYLILFHLVLLCQGINTVVAQFSNGIGKIKIFAFNGIINTFVTVLSNIVLLAKFKMGIEGYLLSILLANIISIVFIILSVQLWNYIKVPKLKSKLVKEMLNYSIPLIPNTLMWWIMNVSDRYVITFMVGVAANGLYAVANKIPTVLYILNTIFYQSWQHSAIEESDSKYKSEFYSNVFNLLSVVMLISASFILTFIRPTVKLLISTEFSDSWRYVPFLLLAAVFSSFSSFLGTNYIAMKETKGASKTSVIGATLNMILNLILVPIMGLNGAAFATALSFAVMWIMRIFDTKKFVIIKIHMKTFILTLFVIFFQILILYMDYKYNLIIQLFLSLCVSLVNLKTLRKLAQNTRKLLIRH